jgi:hypothetical protein
LGDVGTKILITGGKPFFEVNLLFILHYRFHRMFGDTISKFLKLDNLISNLTGLVETKIELLKVEVKEDIVSGLAKGVIYFLLAFVFGLVILLISLGIAVLLAEEIGALGGYGIVAVFYLIIGLILMAKREDLIAKVEKALSKNSKKKK